MTIKCLKCHSRDNPSYKMCDYHTLYKCCNPNHPFFKDCKGNCGTINFDTQEGTHFTARFQISWFKENKKEKILSTLADVFGQEYDHIQEKAIKEDGKWTISQIID